MVFICLFVRGITVYFGSIYGGAWSWAYFEEVSVDYHTLNSMVFFLSFVWGLFSICLKKLCGTECLTPEVCGLSVEMKIGPKRTGYGCHR